MADHKLNFDTARLRELRATELNRTDERTVSHIEEFGCSILTVGRDCKDDLNWTYSIGIFDTCGAPELITIGLPSKIANACLNEAARQLRAGIDLTKGRQTDLLGNVDCELRPVDSKWVKHLMNWANWYNARSDYPVLQIVYPDLENRFPEDESFKKRFVQPLMQPGAPFTEVERGFWDSVDDDEKFKDWKFPDPPHTGVYVSNAVHQGDEQIMFVSHDADDGAWQFLGDSMSDSGGVLSCLHHPIDGDPSLLELADLPLGWYAERATVDDPWERYKCEEEEAGS